MQVVFSEWERWPILAVFYKVVYRYLKWNFNRILIKTSGTGNDWSTFYKLRHEIVSGDSGEDCFLP